MQHAASRPGDLALQYEARPRHHVALALAAALLALAFALVPANAAAAPLQTVCTITVNSADEKEALRRHLPPDRFRFVELVERGRPDWLASAREQNIRCDVLVISGHFDGGIDGGNEFFSERVEAREFLPVAEMERASCSADDHGIFANLKEVYLFGCNTINPESFRNGAGEIERSLVRSGQSRSEAARLARALAARHGNGTRDRMRQIFPDVPAIYGFASVAPLGPAAASLLGGYLKAGGTSDFGTGRPSQRLLAALRQDVVRGHQRHPRRRSAGPASPGHLQLHGRAPQHRGEARVRALRPQARADRGATSSSTGSRGWKAG
jgi:hypothetical protein